MAAHSKYSNMADQLGSFKIFCKGGLNTSRDVLSQGEQSPGSAIKLVNYEPSVAGGYRKINGYSNDYGTVPGLANQPVLGVCVANGMHDGIFACKRPNVGITNYLYKWNEISSSWDSINVGSPTTTPDMTNVSKIRFTKFNFSEPSFLMTDGVNPAACYTVTDGYVQIDDVYAPTAPKLSAVFKKHIFLAADPAESQNVYISAPYAPNNFDPAAGASVINIGFPVVAMKPFRDTLYVFGTNNISRITGSNINDWAVESVTDDLGCLATDSVIEIGGDLLFLSQDGLRPISGTDRIGDVNLETLSKDIQSVFTDVVFDIDLEGLNSVIIRQKSQFRYFFGAADSQGIIGGFRETDQGGIKFEYSNLLGISATCADSGYIGQNEYVIHGDSTGKVHRQETGNSFDGLDIFSAYQTPYLHMQDPEQRKIFYNVATYMRSEGDNELILSIVYDYEDFDTLNPINYFLDNTGAAAYYNSASYNSTAIFDGNPSPVQSTNISGSGKSVSFKYVTSDTNASHSIQGIVVTYGTGDRL